MTDTEQKALALVNEVRLEREVPLTERALDRDSYTYQEALCRAIEQHEAFRQEVSDAIEHRWFDYKEPVYGCLERFIIAKPDPLVEALAEATGQGENYTDERDAAALRAAIEKRGGKIVWGEG